jgi:prepilin-type N-terminal cleavage/methylation domain-containing protein
MFARLTEPHQASPTRGFTMVEMVVIIVILGVMSVYIVPKLNLSSGLREEAWRDQIVSALRYARQSAVSHRRLVCVTVGASSISLQIASANPAVACTADLAGPDGTGVFASDISDGTGNTVSPSGTIYIQPDGRVSTDGAGTVISGRTISIDGSLTNTIDILGETGYVE